MTQFTAEIRVKNNFQHVQRLHNMLYGSLAKTRNLPRRKEGTGVDEKWLCGAKELVTYWHGLVLMD